MVRKIGDWIAEWEEANPNSNAFFSVRNGASPPSGGAPRLAEIERNYGFTRDQKSWRLFPKERKAELMAIGSLLNMLDEVDRHTSDLMALTNRVSEDGKRLEKALMQMEGGPEMMEALMVKFPGLLHRKGAIYEA